MYTQANKQVYSKILSEEMLVHYTENPYKLASRCRSKNYQTISNSHLSHKYYNIPDISRWHKLILTRQTLDKLVKEISSNIKWTDINFLLKDKRRQTLAL